MEDVHIESEETAHLLRKKHQEVVADFQEQLDQLAKAKARYDKIVYKPSYSHTLHKRVPTNMLLIVELKKKR